MSVQSSFLLDLEVERSRAWLGMTYHSDNLSLHLSHAREHIRMDGVRHGELPKRFRLQPHQLLPTMIDSAADPAIFPPRVLHLRQLIELAPHLLFGPSLGGQRRYARHAGTRRYQFALELEDGLGDLGLHFGAHAGRPEEKAVQSALDIGVDVDGGADQAAALELIEELAGPAEHK